MTSNLHSFLSDRKRRCLPRASRLETNCSNELLEVPEVAASLLPELRIVPLTVNQVLYEQGDKIDVVYFPLDSVISGLAIMEDGTTIETSMVGREGMVGISHVLGSGRSRQWIWVTISGNAIQLEAQVAGKFSSRTKPLSKPY